MGGHFTFTSIWSKIIRLPFQNNPPTLKRAIFARQFLNVVEAIGGNQVP
jgi:hypothetical protein